MVPRSGSPVAAAAALVVTLVGIGAWSATAAPSEHGFPAMVTASSPVKPAGAARTSAPAAILAACVRRYGIRPSAGIPPTAYPPQLVQMCGRLT